MRFHRNNTLNTVENFSILTSHKLATQLHLLGPFGAAVAAAEMPF